MYQSVLEKKVDIYDVFVLCDNALIEIESSFLNAQVKST